MQKNKPLLLCFLLALTFINAQNKRMSLNEVSIKDSVLYNLIDKYNDDVKTQAEKSRWGYVPFDIRKDVYLIKKDESLPQEGFLITDVRMKELKGLEQFKYSSYFIYKGALVLVNDNISDKYVNETSTRKSFDFYYDKDKKVRKKHMSLISPIFEPTVYFYKMVNKQLVLLKTDFANIY